MKEFFGHMSPLELSYWIIALAGSAVFLIIFLFTFLGGGDSDMEVNNAEFSSDDGGVGFQFFTFKNIVAFFTIFGWTGVTCIESQVSSTATLFISSIAGLIMMVLTSLLFFLINKLAHSGTLKIDNAIGVLGQVYIPVGASRSKVGKIQVIVQGSLRELDAITDAKEDLKTGDLIKVLEVLSAELLLVEKSSN